jgi:hypothetical protein
VGDGEGDAVGETGDEDAADGVGEGVDVGPNEGLGDGEVAGEREAAGESEAPPPHATAMRRIRPASSGTRCFMSA